MKVAKSCIHSSVCTFEKLQLDVLHRLLAHQVRHDISSGVRKRLSCSIEQLLVRSACFVAQ